MHHVRIDLPASTKVKTKAIPTKNLNRISHGYIYIHTPYCHKYWVTPFQRKARPLQQRPRAQIPMLQHTMTL